MEINFNTNFKDFFSKSPAYKAIEKDIDAELQKRDLSEETLRKCKMAFVGYMECAVMNINYVDNRYYSSIDLENMINNNNSQGVKAFFKEKNAHHNALFLQNLVHLHLLYNPQQVQELKNELIPYVNPMPQVDFNKNFKGFIESSIAYSHVVNFVQEFRDFKHYKEEDQKHYLALAYSAFEAVVINFGMHNSRGFTNASLEGTINKHNSKHVREYIKQHNENPAKGKFMKCVVQLALTEQVDGKLLQEKVYEEIMNYQVVPKKSIKSKP